MMNSTPARPYSNYSPAATAYTMAIESHLNTFIRWVLRITASGDCAGKEAVDLLEQAWSAQKLVWQLREQRLNAR